MLLGTNLGTESIGRYLAAQKAAGHKAVLDTLATQAGVGRTSLRGYLAGSSDLPVGRLSAVLTVVGCRLSVEPLKPGTAGRTVDAADLGALLQAARDAAAAAGVELDIRISPAPAGSASPAGAPAPASANPSAAVPAAAASGDDGSAHAAV